MIIIGDKFYLNIISDILRGKGLNFVVLSIHSPRRWWKSSLATYQMVVWYVEIAPKKLCESIFDFQVGNDDVRPLFEAFGTVTECEVIKNYG